MKKYNFTALCLFFFVLMITLSGCSAPGKTESLKYTGIFFDTVVQIEVWGTERTVLDGCVDMCEKYEQMFSPSIKTSEVSLINNAGGLPVTVSQETADLIRLGLKYCELSDGRFDITVAPLSELWNFRNNPEGTIPDPSQLQEAASHVDYRTVILDGNTVSLSDPDAKIDLGGIAKGYIADRIKEYLVDEGVLHATINLGGNMLAIGRKPDGSAFRIGIQKPFAEEGTVAAVLSVSDQSVVSSGNYERYFEKDGIIYHHILDPDTGYPVQNDLDQVTIISDSSADGDALSTACFALGSENAMNLIRNLDGTEAVFITKTGQILLSSPDIPLETSE